MIRPTHIEIHNYVQLKDVSLNLGKGVYFITGENRDEQSQVSNGAGKSLLCSAFVWGLFEDILRKDVKRDDVIGPFDEYCSVKVEFDVDGKNVRVNRWRNHPEYGNDVELWVDGEDRTHSTSKRKTTEAIQRELGVSKEVLYYCAYYDSNNPSLVSLTSSELNRVVSEIIGTARYDQWLKDIRSRRRDTEADRKSDLKLLKVQEERYESVEEDIASYEDDLESFEDEKQAQIEQIEADIEAHEEEKEEFVELCDNEDEVRKEYEDLEDEVSGLEEGNRRIKRLQRDLDTQRKRKQSKENKLAKLDAAMQSVEDNLENLTGNPSGECDVCGNLLSNSDKLGQKVDKFQREYDKKEVKRTEVKVDIETLKSKISDLEEEIEEVEQEVEEGRDKLDRYKKLESKIGQFDRANKFIKKTETKIDKLEKRLSEVKSKSSDHIEDKIESKSSDLEEISDQVEQYRKQIEQADIDIEACDALEDGVKKTKAARFNSFIVRLQNGINECLDAMTGGDYHCKLQQDGSELALRFTNVSKKGKYYSYHVFSKGERARISKSAAVALNKMMSVGFIVDDEAVEGVDDPGIHAILEFVVNQNRDNTLLFVGHQTAMNDHFRGCTNFHVIKEEGESRVVVNRNFSGQEAV